MPVSSLLRRARKTSHQKQIDHRNEAKCKAIHAQAHAHATTLVAKEGVMQKEVRKSTERLCR